MPSQTQIKALAHAEWRMDIGNGLCPISRILYTILHHGDTSQKRYYDFKKRDIGMHREHEIIIYNAVLTT
jgi:hypothetical protein